MARPPPPTRYAQSSGAKIAYQVSGTGPPDLVMVPGLVSHLDLQWQQTGYRRFIRALEQGSRLIRLDKRGTGLSDPAAALPATGQRVQDVGAVMAAARSPRAVLFGLSDGGRAAIAFAAAHPGHGRGPDRVARADRRARPDERAGRPGAGAAPRGGRRPRKETARTRAARSRMVPGGRPRPRRPAVGWESLTEAELPVVRLAAEGHANAEIAARLCLSRYTVETHLKHIFAKLGVESRAELAALAAARDSGVRANT